MKAFAELTEREILAVAISAEEEDSRIYMSFAEDLAGRYPDSARVFEEMAEEEKTHRHMLLEMYEQRFGPDLPPIRRSDVKGFLRRRPHLAHERTFQLDDVRKEAETWSSKPHDSTRKATEAGDRCGRSRKLLGDLAEMEKGHETSRRQD